MKRSIVLSLILAICCLLPFTASAEEWSDFFALNEETAIGYDEALISYQDTPNAPAGTRIELLPSAATLSGDAVLAQEAIITGDGESTAVWTVDVPVTGLYELEITYFAQDGNEAKVQRRLTIDGIVPYEEANNICLYRRFVERASEIGRKNSIDDEVWARQDEIHLWQTVRAADGQGVYVDPLKFCLTAGRHEISLHYVDQPVTLGTLALVAPAAHPTYAEAAAGYAAQGLKAADKDVQIKFQAENSAWRSENVIRRESDADPMTEPRSGANRVLNVMGGWRWRLGNAAVAWNFDVPEDGLYAITDKGLRNSQICESSLAYSVRLRCDKNLAACNRKLRRKSQVKAAVTKRPNGTYTAALELEDDMGSVMDLKLAIPREDMAKFLTERFRKSPERLYSEIMRVLMSSDPEEEKSE